MKNRIEINKNISIFYHSDKSGATQSILTLKYLKDLQIFFIKLPKKFFRSLVMILKSYKQILSSEVYILNGLAIIRNPVIFILNFISIFRNKRKVLYWHESNWLWRIRHHTSKYRLDFLIKTRIYENFLNNLIRKNKNIADSQYCANWVKKNFNIKTKIDVLYETIDFTQISKLKNLNNSEKFNKEYKLVMAAGRMIPRKGFKYFLKVAERVSNNYQFIWIGKIGKLEHDFKNKIEYINKSSGYQKVKVLDYSSNLYSILNQGQIFFLPSLDEPFGIVYLEAMAVGNYIICPKKSGFSELINDENEGYVYNTISEVISLLSSNKIDALIRDYRNLRITTAKKYEKKYFIQNFIDKIKKF